MLSQQLYSAFDACKAAVFTTWSKHFQHSHSHFEVVGHTRCVDTEAEAVMASQLGKPRRARQGGAAASAVMVGSERLKAWDGPGSKRERRKG